MGALVIDSNDVVAADKGDKHDLFSDSGVHWSDLGAGTLADFIDEKALGSMTPQSNLLANCQHRRSCLYVDESMTFELNTL